VCSKGLRFWRILSSAILADMSLGEPCRTLFRFGLTPIPSRCPLIFRRTAAGGASQMRWKDWSGIVRDLDREMSNPDPAVRR